MNEWTFDPIASAENRWIILVVWVIALAGYLYLKYRRR